MPNLTTEPVVSPLSWRIGGMDCAGCAAKIRGALERMPGVSDVRLSVMTETLTLALDEDKTSRTAIETQVSGLGYSVKAIEKPSAKTAGAEPPSCGCGHDHHKNDGHNHGHTRGENGKSVAKSDKGPKPDAGQGQPGHVHEITPEGMSWYQTGKGRLVLGTGSLLAAAWGAKFLAPGIANWAFIAACLIGVAPIALRAFAALRAGMPQKLVNASAAGAPDAVHRLFLFADFRTCFLFMSQAAAVFDRDPPTPRPPESPAATLAAPVASSSQSYRTSRRYPHRRFGDFSGKLQAPMVTVAGWSTGSPPISWSFSSWPVWWRGFSTRPHPAVPR